MGEPEYGRQMDRTQLRGVPDEVVSILMAYPDTKEIRFLRDADMDVYPTIFLMNGDPTSLHGYTFVDIAETTELAFTLDTYLKESPLPDGIRLINPKPDIEGGGIFIRSEETD